MGRELIALLQDDARFRLSAALVRPEAKAFGQRVPGTALHYGSELPMDTAVVIDFSLPPALPALCESLAERGIPLVSGTTGLDTEAEQALDRLAERVPVLWAPNFSLGILVLTRLARDAARWLAAHDVGIIDIHHQAKLDAPSGTALRLGAAIAEVRGRAPDYACLRVGGVVGDHAVVLAGPDETLELRHHAQDRRLFARGALVATHWLLGGRAPGRYRLEDVLTS
ncbi:MAG: 4-hydroxy-tetrahydrodipicolinate reductase [Xanthomonadales bacterium]|jgi:4-hydroxy-tetrahydrodipicolinate reductase|nr:4-hydroxy-tetrahydrodipicolinate reductase [Xanthomonadales bacterium]